MNRLLFACVFSMMSLVSFLPSARAAEGTSSPYADAAGEIDPGIANAGGTLDILGMEVSNTVSDVYMTLTVNGNVSNPNDWGNFMIGIASGKSAGTATENGWARPINLDGPSGDLDFWIGSWVNAGGGSHLWHYTNAAWSGPLACTFSFMAGAQSTLSYTVPLATLGLAAGDTFYFDAYASGGGGTDSAVDALANPNVSITSWSQTYTSKTTGTGGVGLNAYTVSGGAVFSATVSPTNGPYSGGNSVVVTNASAAIGNGADITNIVLGAVGTTNITGQGTNWVSFIAPATGSAGVKDLVIQSASLGGTTLANAYTYNQAGSIGVTVYGPVAWTNLGSGMNNNVRALVHDGANLYAGGDFTTAGGLTVNRVAKWNAASGSWTNLGSGMNGSVRALLHDGTNLYAGGTFTTAGGVTANRVAKWNAASGTWTNMGGGMNGSVYALAHDGTNLYAGGAFLPISGVEAKVGKWDAVSGTWTNLASSWDSGTTAYALAHDGARLFAGGYLTHPFEHPNYVSARYVFQWSGDGGPWVGIGGGMNNTVLAFNVDGTNLYVGGDFTKAGGLDFNYVVKWNTTAGAWTNLGGGMNSSVNALARDGVNLYAGGAFTTAGGIAANRVAKWDSALGAWTNLTSGMNNTVDALAHDGTSLYAGGIFSAAGGVSASYVAKWGPSIVETSGIVPSIGSWTGGYQVVIVGTNLSSGVGSDIEWVTLAGVTAEVQSVSGSTQVVVVAGASSSGAVAGDVRVSSTSFGETVKSNAFEYLKEVQVALTFEPTSPQTYNTTNTLSTSGGSGTGTVSYAVSSGPGAIVDGTNLVVSSGTGTVTVVVTKAQDARYFATSATGTVAAAKAEQAIVFPNPGGQVTTNATALTATAASGLPVSFAVVSGAAVLENGTNGTYATYGGAGDVSIAATQGGDDDWLAAPAVTNTFTVSLTAQAALGFAPASPQTYNTTNALATSGGSGTGTVSYAVLSGPGAITGATNLVATSGTGEIVVEATKAADAMYAAQSASATVTVARAAQAIDFTNPGTQFWTNTAAIAATAGSGLDVQFAVVSGPASLTGPTSPTSLTFDGYGEVRIAASQAGDADWQAAATVTNTFSVVGPQLAVLGTNGAVIESSTGVSPVTGTHFGAAIIGLETVTNVFTLTNAGNALLTMVTYETNGTHGSSFRLLDVPATVPAGTSAVFSVVFDPQDGGSNTASFVFSFDGTNSPYTVNVAGVGLGGGIALETNALAFAASYAGTNPASQSLVMTNVGGSGFTWTNTIAYSTGASNWLSVVPDAGTVSLASETSLTNSVDISGIAVGTHTATVTIAALDATNSPQVYLAVLTVGRATQAITFPNPGLQVVTNETPIAATASSGLAVSVAVVSGAASLASPTSPTSLTYADPGLVTLRATQAGDDNWQAAAAVQITFRVRPDRVPYADFDGDGRSDLTVYWPEGGTWFNWLSATDTVVDHDWGWAAVAPVPADYDGDGVVDHAVYHPATGNWYIRKSSDGKKLQRQFGWGETEPVPGDYDGDGLADLAVFRRRTGMWHISRHDWSGYREVKFGWHETVPVPADYDGDGITDIAVYWPSKGRWHILRSSDGQYEQHDWGWSRALPVPADYDGDGLADIAVYSPEKGTWYIRQSSDSKLREQRFGWFRCLPVPGDFDGDGIDDLAVYEPGESRWSILHAPGRYTTRIFGWSETLPPWTQRR